MIGIRDLARTVGFSLLLLILNAAVYAAPPTAGKPGEQTMYSLPPDITELRAGYQLDEAAETTLRHNGFVVLDAVSAPGLHEAYPRRGHLGRTYVTTDAMLYLWYDLYHSLLASAERDAFYPHLREAIAALVRGNIALQQTTHEERAQDALRRSLIILCVADRLLREDAAVPPAQARAEVEALVSKILAHTEYDFYPGEDFTQYTVRGHYAESLELARYFRGSMWLSRRFMPIDANTRGDAPLRDALALAAVVWATPNAREPLKRLLAARESLTGRANAISIEQLIGAADRVLGKDWSLSRALRPEALAQLRSELAKAEYPAASVQALSMGGTAPFPKKIAALLPNFAVPDSVLFQSTVDPSVPGRNLPSGCDVAAALGFRVAREQLAAQEPNAPAILAAIDRHRALQQDDGKTVYAGWLHALSTLSAVPTQAPEFMRGDAWQYEKLNTCLSSWAQLRHAYILYAAELDNTASMVEAGPTALVEPNPPFYHALAGLAQRARTVLTAIDALSAQDAELLHALAQKCRDFETYSEAELSGTLTDKQSSDIDGFGPWLEQFHLTSRPLVADVATGLNGEVLHAAIGNLNPLIVIPDRKKGLAYVGWVMSYYEFQRPNHDRLTDARWQAELADLYLRPDRPAWASGFVATEQGPEWEAQAPLREAERLLLANQAAEGLALLRPFLARSPFSGDSSEAVSLLMTALRSNRPGYGPRPQDFFAEGAKPVRNALFKAAYYSGHIKEAIDIALLFQTYNASAHELEDYEFAEVAAFWNALPDSETPALSMLAVAEGHDDKNREEKALTRIMHEYLKRPTLCRLS